MKIEKLLELKKDFGPVPFWFWNSDLSKETLEAQMHEMKRQHVYEFIIHARRGLTIEYLSEDWFDRVKFVVEKAKELDMKLWIYDEENWPSGYCGGKVIKDNHDFCAKHLKMIRLTLEQLDGELHKKSVGILIEKNNRYHDISQELDHYPKHQEVLLFTMENTLWHPAYFDGYYTDLLNIHATNTFMKYTHRAYEKRFKDYFGSIIKGFFTDEPGFYNNLYMFSGRDDLNTVVWTTDFSLYFEKRNHYSIIEYLPYLWIKNEQDENDLSNISHKIRYDFYQTVTDMYIENFFKPQRDFCEHYGMKLIGHVDFEDFLHMQVSVQGDMTRTVGALHYAGVDKIDQNNEKITEKVISSIGHMYGQERVLSETYALCGWGLDFQEMKRIADYQYVRGINLLNPHAFYFSIEEDRKWECPPSQFNQNPYWTYYHRFSNYITRLSYLLSQGTHVADVAIYYPMPTAYDLYQPSDKDRVIKVDQLLHNLTFTLLENQYDFDFINDDAILNAKLDAQYLMMKGEKFRLIILPHVTTLLYETAIKLYQFVSQGGILLMLEKIPTKCVDVDKQIEYDELVKKLYHHDSTYYLDDYMLTKSYTYKFDIKKFDIIYHQIMPKADFFKLDPHLDIALFDILYSDALSKDVFLKSMDPHIKYLHRQVDNLDIYYFINEDSSFRKNTLKIKSSGLLKEIDLYSGKVLDCECKVIGVYLELKLILPPLGS